MTEKKTTEKIAGTWAQLQKKFYSLRPIRNDYDYDKALAAADQLTGRDDLTGDQRDYLDVLVTLLGVYEDVHYAIDTSDADPVETLKFLLDQNEMNPSDLGRLLGDRSLGSRILSGERQLSKKHIAIVADRFAVNPSLFLPSLEQFQGNKGTCGPPAVERIGSSGGYVVTRHVSSPVLTPYTSKIPRKIGRAKCACRAAAPQYDKHGNTPAVELGEHVAPRHKKGVRVAAKKKGARVFVVHSKPTNRKIK